MTSDSLNDRLTEIRDDLGATGHGWHETIDEAIKALKPIDGEVCHCLACRGEKLHIAKSVDQPDERTTFEAWFKSGRNLAEQASEYYIAFEAWKAALATKRESGGVHFCTISQGKPCPICMSTTEIEGGES